jgi:hypothetical protein
MADQNNWQKVETTLLGILHIQGVHQMLIGSMLALMNQEMPDFKSRMIASMRQLSSADERGQAMIDRAVKLVSELSDDDAA